MMNSTCALKQDAIFHIKMNVICNVGPTNDRRVTYKVHDTFRNKFGTIKNI